MDRRFIDKYMPELAAWLHYRTVDVSTIKELARRWYPQVFEAAPKKNGDHWALGDIEDSIAELKYYRELKSEQFSKENFTFIYVWGYLHFASISCSHFIRTFHLNLYFLLVKFTDKSYIERLN